MYLNRFQSEYDENGSYHEILHKGCYGGFEPNVLLDEIDATLNSWKEAHEIMKQQNGDMIYSDVFIKMRNLVYLVLKDRSIGHHTSYPVEALTFCLLVEWIKNK